jgi:hypothetical protein
MERVLPRYQLPFAVFPNISPIFHYSLHMLYDIGIMVLFLPFIIHILVVLIVIFYHVLEDLLILLCVGELLFLIHIIHP